MTDNNQPKPKPTNFSSAFQQLASFVAIAKTTDPAETRENLILQCFIILPDDRFSNAAEIADAVYALFGIQIPERHIELSLRTLIAKKSVIDLTGGHLGLSSQLRTTLESRLKTAKQLEQDVRKTWFEQIGAKYPKVSPDKAWEALKAYLSDAFRRHGMQAVALLDPSFELDADYARSLTSILRSVVDKRFSNEDRESAREAVGSFLATANIDRQRAEYISQVADSAFNYFSLTVAPEVAEQLRTKLSPLTLFLDTNFLFGILDLHVHTQVDVSAELLDAVRKFHLPFRLSYHEATDREMRNTLFYFSKDLKKHKWPQQISRAAVNSGAISGIELKYHQSNSEQRLDVEDFFAPYDHWEILVKDRGINVYKVTSTPRSLTARADLEAEYRTFLEAHEKDKPYEAIQHDMALLETVHSLRSSARNTLEAGALLVTCDYYLYRFDWENSRAEGKLACTVLPNLLWQILRPYITDSLQFDKAFAETFALPEFAAFGGGAARAASKMLSILAGYQQLPEETATKMLSNDLLIAQLQTKTTEHDFVDAVESALAAQNYALNEEKAALHQQLQQEKLEKANRGQKAKEAEEKLRLTEDQVAEKQKALEDKDQAIQILESEKSLHAQRATDAAAQLSKEQQDKATAQREAEKHRRDKDAADKRAELTARVACLSVGMLVALLFEIVVNFVFKWDWLLSHPNSYGLQGCMSGMLIFGILGIGAKKWRRVSWSVVLFGLLAVFFQILGGPRPKP
jgi:hypothetical protein